MAILTFRKTIVELESNSMVMFCDKVLCVAMGMQDSQVMHVHTV